MNPSRIFCGICFILALGTLPVSSKDGISCTGEKTPEELNTITGKCCKEVPVETVVHESIAKCTVTDGAEDQFVGDCCKKEGLGFDKTYISKRK